MKNNYRSLLRVFLLFAFVSLMLCPYASLLSAAHGGNTLIQQEDFRKTKKLVKVESELPENHAIFNNNDNAALFLPSDLKQNQQVFVFFHRSIALTITSIAQLLL